MRRARPSPPRARAPGERNRREGTETSSLICQNSPNRVRYRMKLVDARLAAAARRLRLALDLFTTGERLMRQRPRRGPPRVWDEENEARGGPWGPAGPGGPVGGSPGATPGAPPAPPSVG